MTSNVSPRLDAGDPSERINPQPCVPSVVNTCIRLYRIVVVIVRCHLIPILIARYLELHGLNTVGIFRVGSSKKRVRQVTDKSLLTF